MVDFKVNLIKHFLMNLAEKKETLMHIVQDADDKLTDLIIALANEYNDADVEYTDEELSVFEERKLEFFNSDKEGSTVKEAHARIRRNYKNGI